MKKMKTGRGFAIINFEDQYGASCSLQKSSIATEDTVWLGPNDPNLQVMASKAKELGINTEATAGWIPYPVPDDVSARTRMHLSQDQAREIAEVLLYFAENGELPE